jgi:phosphate acetyltransferase
LRCVFAGRGDGGGTARPDRADPGRPARAHPGSRGLGRIDLSGIQIVDAPHSEAAAAAAVQLVREGKAEALMKGSLHTDEIMAAVVKRETGPAHLAARQPLLRDGRAGSPGCADHHRRRGEHRSHAGGQGPHPAERDRPGHAMGLPEVRVAILSAMETVNPKVPSTIEAAALCKMLDRGQITGALVDGPLALDNAINLGAAKIKKINSPVAGRANVLMVPNLEAGNMLAKSLSFLAGADSAGIVLGAKVPIILTSRADSVLSRLASCAVAVMVAQARREAASKAVE